jgi:hypothetical protein
LSHQWEENQLQFAADPGETKLLTAHWDIKAWPSEPQNHDLLQCLLRAYEVSRPGCGLGTGVWGRRGAAYGGHGTPKSSPLSVGSGL